MPYISNAKIDYNFISPSFQYTQLQHFCLQIPQQRAGYSTSNKKQDALRYYVFVLLAWSSIIHACLLI